jgi:hypothetical protein
MNREPNLKKWPEDKQKLAMAGQRFDAFAAVVFSMNQWLNESMNQ